MSSFNLPEFIRLLQGNRYTDEEARKHMWNAFPHMRSLMLREAIRHAVEPSIIIEFLIAGECPGMHETFPPSRFNKLPFIFEKLCDDAVKTGCWDKVDFCVTKVFHDVDVSLNIFTPNVVKATLRHAKLTLDQLGSAMATWSYSNYGYVEAILDIVWEYFLGYENEVFTLILKHVSGMNASKYLMKCNDSLDESIKIDPRSSYCFREECDQANKSGDWSRVKFYLKHVTLVTFAGYLNGPADLQLFVQHAKISLKELWEIVLMYTPADIYLRYTCNKDMLHVLWNHYTDQQDAMLEIILKHAPNNVAIEFLILGNCPTTGHYARPVSRYSYNMRLLIKHATKTGNWNKVVYLVGHEELITVFDPITPEILQSILENGVVIADDINHCICQWIQYHNIELVKIAFKMLEFKQIWCDHAFQYWNSEIVALCMEHGVLPETAMDTAVRQCNVPMMQFVLEHGGILPETAMNTAVRHYNVPMMQFMLEHGGNLDGMNLVLFGCNTCHSVNELSAFVNAIKFMLERGVVFDEVPQEDLHRALISAVMHDSTDAAKLFMKFGADPTYQKNQAFRVAMKRCCMQIVDMFLTMGCYTKHYTLSVYSKHMRMRDLVRDHYVMVKACRN